MNLSLGAVQAVSGAVCAALLLVQVLLGPVNVVVLLLLFPIFLVSVSVVSYLCGEGMYYWNRARAGFERYDSESHPVRAFVYFLLFTAGDACFVVLFLKIQSGAG